MILVKQNRGRRKIWFKSALALDDVSDFFLSCFMSFVLFLFFNELAPHQ